MLPKILNLIPDFDTYYEPFVGGGALFFELSPKKAVINDVNKELITAYKVIKKSPQLLSELLMLFEKSHNEDFYKWVREFDRNLFNSKNRIFSDLIIAARFIYLNKSCFNGIYRVNKNNFFNVPSAKKEKVKLFTWENLIEVSEYLNKNEVKIYSTNFENVVSKAKKDDFVYFDPPYDFEKSGFDNYQSKPFGKEGQIKLALICHKLNQNGVKFLVSNHDTKLINSLYKDFNIKKLKVKRLVSAGAEHRKYVDEVLISNYEL